MTASPTLGARHSLEILKPIHNGLLLDGGSLGEVLLPSREVEGQNLAPAIVCWSLYTAMVRVGPWPACVLLELSMVRWRP